jgi:arylsulfatase
MNMIYIIADQMRWDVLGCNGADYIQTPNFDRLAKESVNFSCLYSGNPLCVPARGILATGCYSHKCLSKVGQDRNNGIILPNNIHMAQLLRNNGFSTYGLGKFHCLPYKRNPGFDVFEVAEEGRLEMFRHSGDVPEDAREDYFDYLQSLGLHGMQRAHGIGNNDSRAGQSPLPLEHYVDTWATTRSLEVLEKHINQTPEKNFFLQIGYTKPHAPYDPPAPYHDMYNPLEIPEPWGGPEDLESRNPMMSLFPEMYLFDRMSKMAVQYSRAHYLGLISYLDSQVGRVLDFLDQHDLRDDTLVVFTSDHGDHIGDHGLFFKSFFTEGSARVPLLISMPNQKAGKVCDQPVGQEDIMPTICELLGVKIGNPIDGQSLTPLMDDPSSEHKPFVISQFEWGENMAIMLRENRFKYCFTHFNATEELYDMKNDPHELNNLASSPDYNRQLIHLRELANQWCKENDHDTILADDGQLICKEFVRGDHFIEPSQVMGIRPW